MRLLQLPVSVAYGHRRELLPWHCILLKLFEV